MRLTESDAGFLYGESAASPLQTASISIIEGEVPFERIYEHIASRLHLLPQFRQRLMWVPMNWSHPTWVDDPDFDLAQHIVHHELPPGTDFDDAMDATVELNEGLMDRSRPLWKFFMVSGVPNRTLLLQQVHHAMVDGASAVHLSTVMFDFQADAELPPPPEDEWRPEPLPSPLELISQAWRANAEAFADRNPLRAMQRGMENRELISRGVETMSRFALRPAITAPWNAGVLGSKRRMRFTVHDFAEFREIRSDLGGTVNDVVLAVISEGAARYLADHGEETSNRHLRIMCPVNVRTEDQAGALGNRVSAMFPMLPAWPMNVVERYKEVSTETARIKGAGEAQAMTALQESGVFVPPTHLAPLQLVGTPFDPTAWSAANPLPPAPNIGPRPPNYGINMVVTNVPAMQVPQYIAGHEIVNTTSVMMMSGNLGYSLAVVSYNQKMIFNFTCEPRLLPDLEQMINHVEAAYAELLDAARAESAPAD